MDTRNTLIGNTIPILWFFILVLNPYGAYYYTIYGKIMYALSLALLFLIIVWSSFFKQMEVRVNHVEVVFLVCLFILHLSFEQKIINRYILSYLPVVLIVFSSKFKNVNVELFYKIFLYSLLLGILIHLITLVNPNISGMEIPKNIDADERVLSCIITSCHEKSSLHRFNFIFEEPGYTGTLLALYLILRHNISKWEMLLVVLGGILTVSLFFIGVLPVVLLYRFLNKKTFVIAFVFMLAGYFSAIPFVEYIDNSYVNYQVEHRLRVNDGIVTGFVDNRTDESFEHFFSDIPTVNLIFGYRKPLSEIYDGWTGLSYRNYVSEFGFFNCFILSILLYLLMIKSQNKINALFILLFLGFVFYQRPQVFSIEYLGAIIIFLLKNNKTLWR